VSCTVHELLIALANHVGWCYCAVGDAALCNSLLAQATANQLLCCLLLPPALPSTVMAAMCRGCTWREQHGTWPLASSHGRRHASWWTSCLCCR
jgi:hypothetical protein